MPIGTWTVIGRYAGDIEEWSFVVSKPSSQTVSPIIPSPTVTKYKLDSDKE